MRAIIAGHRGSGAARRKLDSSNVSCMYFSGNSAASCSPAAPRPSRPADMKPATDYIRHAARLARKLQMDAAMGGTPQPDADFYKTLSKALDEIAAGLELVAKRPD